MIHNYTYKEFCLFLSDFCNIDESGQVDDFEIELLLTQLYDDKEYKKRKAELCHYLTIIPRTNHICKFDFKAYYYGVLDIKKMRKDKLDKLYEEEI